MPPLVAHRTERIVIGRTHQNWEFCCRACSFARKLGNCTTYTLRHRVFGNLPLPSQTELDREIRKQHPDLYRGMPSAASAQRQVLNAREDFENFFRAKEEYRENPEKFQGAPKLPGYKKKYRTVRIMRNGFQIKEGKLILSRGRKCGVDFKPLSIMCCQDQPHGVGVEHCVCEEVRIVPQGNTFVVEVAYKKFIHLELARLDPEQALICDLGIKNFVAMVATKPGVSPVLIKGGSLVSLNQWYNKLAAELRQHKHFKHLRVLGDKRNRQIPDLLHKISHFVVCYCLAHGLGKLIIGYNKEWKQECSLGRQNNQKFVMLPHRKFINMLTYKAEEHGIKVIVREESYTSKASSLDFDPIPTYGETEEESGKKPRFSGKRIKRGLYRARDGRLINADINGAINIGRKELGDEWFKNLLELDGGAMDTPVVVRHLHQKVDVESLLKMGVRSHETSCVSTR